MGDGEGIEGTAPFGIPKPMSTPPKPVPQTDGKRASIWPLPGGVRQYKTTLDALLGEIAKQPMPLSALSDHLRERYEVTCDTARKGYVNILTGLGFCRINDQHIELTSEGATYLASGDPLDLFHVLHRFMPVCSKCS